MWFAARSAPQPCVPCPAACFLELTHPSQTAAPASLQVDSFGIPDYQLNSALGRKDGNVYQVRGVGQMLGASILPAVGRARSSACSLLTLPCTSIVAPCTGAAGQRTHQPTECHGGGSRMGARAQAAAQPHRPQPAVRWRHCLAGCSLLPRWSAACGIFLDGYQAAGALCSAAQEPC